MRQRKRVVLLDFKCATSAEIPRLSPNAVHSYLMYSPLTTAIHPKVTPATINGLANPLLILAVPKTSHSLPKCANAIPHVHMHNSYATFS